ncbi:hypothetical protein Tco_0554625 [Tanacetum coccineum]
MLENHDMYSKIDKYVNDVVKEAVHNVVKALIGERFKDLTEFEMKEIIHDRMFESGSYRSHTEHTTLYEALEASKDRENMEEFNEEMAKSHNSSKQKDASQFEQPVINVPIPDDEYFSDSKDIGEAHLPKIKTKPDWLKYVPEEDTPKIPELDWVVPPNDLPEVENN